MAYESTQMKIAVPAGFIVEHCSFINQELSIFRNMKPLARKISQIVPFRVEWNLSGQIVWGSGFPGTAEVPCASPIASVGVPLVEASSFTISNHGILAFIPQSPQETLVSVELEYEPFRDKKLWELFLKVFSPPLRQIQSDLDRFRTRMESAYVDQLFKPEPKELWEEPTPAVVTAA